MDDRKCECGHTNPVGTMLCESCGKPLDSRQQLTAETAKEFPDMRYEGMARRSQTYSKTVIDKIWNFFSSVKIAIYLIIITLIASAVGTIFPQQQYIPVPVYTEPEIENFYTSTYGTLGKIYYLLGFHNLYSSWWFVTLLVMIGTSLVICSLDRIIPLYKALNKPRLNQHESFLKGQKIYGSMELQEDKHDLFPRAAEELKKKGYRIYQEGNSLMGEKARFSRWGPYVNHIGLIIFLLGVLLRNLPGFYMNEYVWVREGQTVAISGTPYYIKNEQYTTEYWKEDEMPEKLDLQGGVIPKSYQTDAVLYVNKNKSLPGAEPDLQEVARGPIVVNHPLEYEDLLVYQSGVQEMQLGALNFQLIDTKAGNTPVGSVKLDLFETKPEQQVADGIKVRVLDYYPDFFLDASGKPATKTNVPNNPMFALEITSDKEPVKEKLVYLRGSIITEKQDQRYTLQIVKPDLIDISGLLVRKDKAMPIIYFGAFIVILGLVMGFYWQHRRIWLQRNGDTLHLAAHTNKNWFGIRKEVDHLVEKLELVMLIEQKKK
ncbi:cytochrome c biogenesis protein ResB [Brevibacillus fulvus]|uniref:Cytochrome c biogenesis protein n=1 Tax=Brevibacillus fulvus TaxID=1125967 RepID=A0A938XXA1_9BACL|nr:cytochrome c biogenesis protein ResB [Brevibacillus fulvus]MBM7588659.1 cytochrome c biogenesis protein [Brevibacillus fulvus]